MPRNVKNPYMGDAMQAVAAWLELEATIKMIEVATMRGDTAKAEELRTYVHECLDMHINAKQTAIQLARTEL